MHHSKRGHLSGSRLARSPFCPLRATMPATAQDTIRYASDSGFPLQIAVQHAVDESARQTGWGVRYVEHGWVHPHDHQRGFIDLVLHSQKGPYFFVVECKRQRDATWVFMHHSGNAADRRHARPWVTHVEPERIEHHGWAHAPLDPPCPEGTYCALRGESASERNTLLEQTGSKLISATESLAHAERDFRRVGESSTRFYFPLLVTTAVLKVADFDPATVSLVDGKLAAAAVKDVPYVRFRKQLATRFVPLTPEDVGRLGDPSYSMESSIFVVRAESLIRFLTAFEPPESYTG